MDILPQFQKDHGGAAVLAEGDFLCGGDAGVFQDGVDSLAARRRFLVLARFLQSGDDVFAELVVGLLEEIDTAVGDIVGLNGAHYSSSPSASIFRSSIIISGTSIFTGHRWRQRPQVRQV